MHKKIIIILFTAIVTTAAICCAVFYGLNLRWASQGLSEKEIVIQPKSYVPLLFVGDLFFDRGIRYYAQKNGGNEFIFEKISPMLLKNDLVVANLEGPITDNKSVSIGTGVGDPNNFVFTFDPSVAKTLFQENIRLVDLGNNHISNFGREGVASTKKYLSEAGVDYFGVSNAERSIIKNINGVKIAFVSYNEFASNDIDSEQKSAIEEIGRLRQKADILVVFAHWGAEYKLVSSSNVQKLAHQFVDAGADLIIGGHPHVIQQMEEYKGKRIYYSLGNFVFDQYGFKNCQDGLGVEVKIDKKTKGLEFKEINFYLQPNGQTIIKN